MIKQSDAFDELIFDYLEGNLSDNEKEAFEILLAENQQLQEQVAAWELTYIVEPLAPTTKFEQKIIARFKSGHSPFLFKLLLFLSFAFLISFNESELPTYPLAGLVDTTVSASTNIKTTPAEKLRSQTSASQKTNEEKNERTPDLEYSHNNNRAQDFNLLKNSRLITTDRLAVYGIPAIIINEAKVAKTTNTSYRHLSHREVRMLNKRKRTDHDQKEAMKFIKGRTPYVVPLNRDNF